MTAKDQLHILNEKINKVRREHQAPYVITIQDEIDIHIALKDEPKQVTDAIELIKQKMAELNKTTYDSQLNPNTSNENWNKFLEQNENYGAFKVLDQLLKQIGGK
jgi:hypothetical protein